MSLESLLILLLLVGICGAIGQAISGNWSGGILGCIVIGFIGWLIGSWLATRLGLGELLPLLPALETVITYGAVALNGIMRHLTLDDNARLVHVIAAPHPSPANGHHRSEQAERSVRALRLATRPRTP